MMGSLNGRTTIGDAVMSSGRTALRVWSKNVVVIAVVLATSVFVRHRCNAADYCYSLDTRPPRRYATKTTYEDVRSDDLRERADLFTGNAARTYRSSTGKPTGKPGRSLNTGPGDLLNLDEDIDTAGTLFSNCTAACVQWSATVDGTGNTDARLQDETVPDDCRPVSLYVLARHGTRYTKERAMDRAAARLKVIREVIMRHALTDGTMCREDLEQLSNWRPRHAEKDDSTLSQSGWQELRELGARYMNTFGVLLNRRTTPTMSTMRDLYDFRYTNYTGRGHRTRDSARAFAQGMWGSYGYGVSCHNFHKFHGLSPCLAADGRLLTWADRTSLSITTEDIGITSAMTSDPIRKDPVEKSMDRKSMTSFNRKWASYHVTMTESSHPDWLLQFYEFCRKYIENVGSRPVVEYELFKSGTEMTHVIDVVNRRLGLSHSTRLGFDDLYLIFETCRLEHSLYGRVRHPVVHGNDGDDDVFDEALEQTDGGHVGSPWCSVLTPDVVDVLEYHQDIKYYWEDGYGHAINYEPSCTLLGDLLHHLTADDKLGRFRFTHSGTLDSFYARLGLFRDDEHLTAANFAFHRQRRSWSTTRNVPMAANVAFVKYGCSATNDYRVVAMVNERVVRLLGGACGLFCPLEALASAWQPIVADCDIERMCER